MDFVMPPWDQVKAGRTTTLVWNGRIQEYRSPFGSCWRVESERGRPLYLKDG